MQIVLHTLPPGVGVDTRNRLRQRACGTGAPEGHSLRNFPPASGFNVGCRCNRTGTADSSHYQDHLEFHERSHEDSMRCLCVCDAFAYRVRSDHGPTSRWSQSGWTWPKCRRRAARGSGRRGRPPGRWSTIDAYGRPRRRSQWRTLGRRDRRCRKGTQGTRPG